ncbi:C40 family peptidase [Isoptericola variabilis]|uniref:NLP/P60 protein n=1 Tax=Isoptericola variabilis (strain 225) TaxID=743718 RepID=F6FTC0_ISOV2|nr:C40 family peptidase [Isoptericola variabilis]AEG45284.1 NLP/P60 protein [Isoptericola variabilis 225]TWH34784.1 Cell wall-associated hydrolases (invasion-associated proteins) [Isoptericola variabilis J7]
MTAGTRGRHRAARRPIAVAPSSTAGRRAAVVATAGGLLISTLGTGTAAQAAPVDNDAANKLSTVDLAALTDQARQALASAPVVTVAGDAKVSVDTVSLEKIEEAITPAPEPEPEPEPAPVAETRTTSSTSSSGSSSASTASSATASVAIPDSAVGSTIISIASRYVGVPYVSGGSSPSGFDCSGFTWYVYQQAGISIPRSSAEQRYAGTVVPRSQAQPGDLIWTPGHIGIYAGGNTQIDAPRPGKTIQFRNIWQSNPTFIRIA